MSGVTLYRAGAHVTDVTFQYGGEITVGSGGSGGENYLGISNEARAQLLGALAEAAGSGVPAELDQDEAPELVMTLFVALFSRTDKDLNIEISEFLRNNAIPKDARQRVVVTRSCHQSRGRAQSSRNCLGGRNLTKHL